MFPHNVIRLSSVAAGMEEVGKSGDRIEGESALVYPVVVAVRRRTR